MIRLTQSSVQSLITFKKSGQSRTSNVSFLNELKTALSSMFDDELPLDDDLAEKMLFNFSLSFVAEITLMHSLRRKKSF